MNDASTRFSPFVNAESFNGNGNGNGAHVEEVPGIRSPFVQSYLLETGDVGDSTTDAREFLLGELQDDELEAAIYDVAGSVADAARHTDSTATSRASLELRFAPLARELDSLLSRTGDRFGARPAGSVLEAELDEALAERSSAPLEPAMENLFGGITRLVKKAVSGAASLAKKGLAAAASLGLKPILDRIRAQIPKFLKKIVDGIINRLPASLQADARKLASKLPIPQSEYGQDEAERAFDVEGIQQEFNESIAEALVNESYDPESEAESWTPARESSIGINDLDTARERFVGQIAALGDGEDPTPAVEGFIPALIPVLKIATKIAGRKRLVGLLASMVSALISRFVGPASSKALSTAIVDSGLKLVGLEVPSESTAHEAIAATVEETVRRVAALPDDTLDTRQLAEAAILREFEAAAAANFPPLLPARVYWKRPELRESDNRRGVWVAGPIGRKRKRYKKYSQVVRTRITPRVAIAIKTFGETPLSDYLADQLGVEPGETLEADVHMYEAMPGMLLGEIDEAEGVNGVEDAYHPLTSEAASLLFGEPGLGQEGLVPLAARAMPVGQRFFRLAVARKVAVIPGTKHRRRKTSLRVSIDTASGAVGLKLFLSERRAQEIAKGMRGKPHAGVTAESLRPIIDRWLRIVLSGRPTGKLRLNHAGLAAADAKGPALKRVPPATLDAFRQQISTATLGGLAEFLGPQSARFISATEDAKDGVTVAIAISGVDVTALRGALSGQGTATTPPAPVAAKPTVTVDVTPGFAHA